MFNQTMNLKKDEWWIPVDCDELILFSKNPRDIIEECEEYNVNCVMGMLIDRIDKNGDFTNLKLDDDIWDKYNLAGDVNIELRGYPACPTKVSLLKNGRVGHGNHKSNYSYHEDGFYDDIMQHHHFRWTDRVVQNNTKQKKGYGVVEKHFEREYNNLEIYMNTFGKIDTEDERFMLQKVGNNYDDYKEWSQLLSKYEGWLINE